MPESRGEFKEKEKEKDVRTNNIVAAKAVADVVRTSLGPKGMDKMIQSPNGEVMISNDGATILKELQVKHPAAQMMVELSKAQDVEAGDGTTSVVVLAGSLLGAVDGLIKKGLHPTTIAEGFILASREASKFLRDEISIPVSLNDRELLIKTAVTSLNSKVVSQHSSKLAPMAVDAVLKIIDPDHPTTVDLNDIRIVNKLGGIIDDTELVDGIVFTQGAATKAGGLTYVKDAKILLIQFQLSAPKPNMDNSLVIDDYTKMDRVISQTRRYLAEIVRSIKKTGCNVLLIQKSILRDAVTDESLQMLASQKIMVITEIERSDIEFISKTLKCVPVASIEGVSADKLGSAGEVEQVNTSGGKVVRVTGVPGNKTVTIFCRGSNKLVLAECERSVHDALCVIRSLVKNRAMVPGGGAPEIELCLKLNKFAQNLGGMNRYCVEAFANALEIIPFTLAENAGLSPIEIVTELRSRHVNGEKTSGINVRKGTVTDMLEEAVLQPLLVSESAITLASETVAMILKIDDVVTTR